MLIWKKSYRYILGHQFLTRERCKDSTRVGKDGDGYQNHSSIKSLKKSGGSKYNDVSICLLDKDEQAVKTPEHKTTLRKKEITINNRLSFQRSHLQLFWVCKRRKQDLTELFNVQARIKKKESDRHYDIQWCIFLKKPEDINVNRKNSSIFNFTSNF